MNRPTEGLILIFLTCCITGILCCSPEPCQKQHGGGKNQHDRQPQVQSHTLNKSHQQLQQQKDGDSLDTASSTTTVSSTSSTTTRPAKIIDIVRTRPATFVQSIEFKEVDSDQQTTGGEERPKRHVHLDVLELGFDHHHHIPLFGFHDYHHDHFDHFDHYHHHHQHHHHH